MKKRQTWAMLSLASLLLGGGAQPLMATDQQAETTRLASCLYKIYIPESSIIASVGPDGTLMVDALVEEAGPIIRAELEKLGSKHLHYLVNTHWHYDHTDGNKYFGKDGTIILAHAKVREYLSSDQKIRSKSFKAYPEYALPQITFTDTTTIHFNGDTIKLIPLTGGHTDGDVIVYFKNANVVQVGDLCFADMIPFIDLEHGGNAEQLADNLQVIIATMPADVRVISGHGPEYGIEDLIRYREMLVAAIEIVHSEMKKGTSLEDMQTVNVLSRWESWERAFTTRELIGFIYHSSASE